MSSTAAIGMTSRTVEAFIASSVREVMPIAAVDDIELPSAPGPVTEAARERLAKRIERELGAPA